MFLDEAIIDVLGGTGGRGAVSWRREKYMPNGGPDGGNGGHGGSVILLADENTDTLSDFSSRKRFEAEKGMYGSGNNRTGKDGEDKVLKVPPGTSIVELDPKTNNQIGIIADLKEHGDQIIVAYGGRGGHGNAHYATSVRQSPDFAELGEPGEHKFVKLELKLVADVGIIGYPSVGKSTLISVISNARPKIAAYPFTTLIPNLGVTGTPERSFVVCDVPGLIEGASEGKGLGDQFLRHIERCGVLLHVLDIERGLREGNVVDADALAEDYRVIRNELERYSPTLGRKKELIILNKVDLINDEIEPVVQALKKHSIEIFMSISAATKLHTQDLIFALLPIVLGEREHREKIEDDELQRAASELPIIRPQHESMRMGAFRIEQKQDGTILIKGRRLEQFTKMTNFESSGGVDRFRDVVDRIGLKKSLKKYIRTEETPIYIGEMRVEDYL